MFIQVGKDVINSDYITAVRISDSYESVKVWLNAPIGPRFFWWSGPAYDEFMRWLRYLNAADSPQVLGPEEE